MLKKFVAIALSAGVLFNSAFALDWIPVPSSEKEPLPTRGVDLCMAYNHAQAYLFELELAIKHKKTPFLSEGELVLDESFIKHYKKIFELAMLSEFSIQISPDLIKSYSINYTTLEEVVDFYKNASGPELMRVDSICEKYSLRAKSVIDPEDELYSVDNRHNRLSVAKNLLELLPKLDIPDGIDATSTSETPPASPATLTSRASEPSK